MGPAGFSRRHFLLGSALHASSPAIVIPVLRLRDKHAPTTEAEFRQFDKTVWNQAVSGLETAAVSLQVTDRIGDIRRYPSGRPLFEGLQRGVINVVLTGTIPLAWDKARSLAGLATVYEGFHLCVIALAHAHGHRVPFLSVNTVLHELLHLLFQDPFVAHPSAFQSHTREARVDAYATRLWLFRDGHEILAQARAYRRVLNP